MHIHSVFLKEPVFHLCYWYCLVYYITLPGITFMDAVNLRLGHTKSHVSGTSLSVRNTNLGAKLSPTCGIRFNFRRSRSMSRRQNVRVFSPLYNMSLQWNRNSWANQRQQPEFFVIMYYAGRQAKSFPATCSYLWDIVTLALACYICLLHIPITRQFVLLHVTVCLLRMSARHSCVYCRFYHDSCT